jgi:acetylornithine/succinyldiaminopimelate/putrescine aminotransferase
VVSSLLNDGWIAHAAKAGAYLKGRLEDLGRKYDFVKEVRGLGLIVGMELNRPCASVVTACLEQGFLINCAQEKVLRFVPPLIVQEDQIDQLAAALDRIFEGMDD